MAGQVKSDDPSAYECVAGHGSASLEASILADVGVLLMAPFLLVGGLILIAAYLVVRFAVIFAPALLTAGAFFPLRGIVLAAGRVVAAAIINGILFTLAVLLVIRVDSAILDPSTALPAWLRLVLVGVVTVVMWYLTRPFRKLTTMVTTGRMAWAMGDRSYYERGGFFGRRRGFDAAIVEDDGHAAVLGREESRGPAGMPRRAAGAPAAVVAPISVPSTRLDGGGSRAAAAAAGAAVGAAAAASGGGSPGQATAATDDGPKRGPTGSGARAAGAATGGSARGRPAATGGGAARVGDSVPVHAPPPNPRRRLVPSPLRVTNRRLDEGLFDAGAPGRPAPEDDARGYLSPVRVEVADDELYRLFDPARPSRSSRNGSGRS